MWNQNYQSGYPPQYPPYSQPYPQTQPSYPPPQFGAPPQSAYPQVPYQQQPSGYPSGINPNYNQYPTQNAVPFQNPPPSSASAFSMPPQQGYAAPQYPPQQQGYPSQPPQQQYTSQQYPQQGYPPQQQSYPQQPPQQTSFFSNQPPVSQPAYQAPTKKALLIGINYTNDPSISLKGPISDVQRIKQYLLTRGFFDSPNTMLILTDDQANPSYQPTRANILNAFNWLIGGTNPGDSLFFLYSGHGGQVQDTNHDEVDGMDETILPVDYKSKGVIVDDTIHDYLVKPLPFGAKLTAIMDCCHSGTGMDLPYVTNLNSYNPDFESLDARKVSVGDIVLFSGCRDNQCSMDTTVTSLYGKSSGGAMTSAFLEAMQKHSTPSYRQILQSMQYTLRSYCQIPQLSSGKPMDMNQPFAL